MTAIMSMGDPVRCSDIAKRFGVVQSAVINWEKRFKDFPEPLLVGDSGLRPTKIWEWAEIEEWARAHNFPGGQLGEHYRRRGRGSIVRRWGSVGRL